MKFILTKVIPYTHFSLSTQTFFESFIPLCWLSSHFLRRGKGKITHTHIQTPRKMKRALWESLKNRMFKCMYRTHRAQSWSNLFCIVFTLRSFVIIIRLLILAFVLCAVLLHRSFALHITTHMFIWIYEKERERKRVEWRRAVCFYIAPSNCESCS